MKLNIYSMRRIMAALVWGAILMLMLTVSNSVAGNNEITLNLSANTIKAFNYAAPLMLLVGLSLAAHLRAETYVRLVCLACIATVYQFSYAVVSEVKLALFIVGSLALARWLLPLIKGNESADILDISDARSAQRQRAS